MKKMIISICICLCLTFSAFCMADTSSKAQEEIADLGKMADEVLHGKNGDPESNEAQSDEQEAEDANTSDDELDYTILEDFYSRQIEYEKVLLENAETRIAEYWNVELINLKLYLDDACIFDESEKEHISTINVQLRWNVENNADRTRNMLISYGDDMAVTLHSALPDMPIDQMYILWEVPYILPSGYAAKFLYYSIGDDMYCSDRYGVLFGRV